MSIEVIIEVKDVSKTYKRGSETVNAVSDINLKLYEAELVVINGESGSGKSTLLNLMSGLDNPTKGTIKFLGEDVTSYSEKKLTDLRRHYVGFIFQSWELIDNLTAVENVEIPLYPDKEIGSAELRTKAREILRRLELMDQHHRKYPHELSGGQAQRVGIARALVKSPKVIFADEPTANLDSDNTENIMRLLKLISRQGTTVIVASHSDRIMEYADKTIHLQDGRMS
ncbi:MAG: ABC transporter ATP-binding protein [Candidatus Heimdallarchaeota archaeon]|nr:ABC transporter ATP-binding protein [Candidatus Heimdallarchaeota archaeon]